MQIEINGEKRDVPENSTVEGLILDLGLSTERLAVERNREVVSRLQWPNIALEENDQLEIIHFVGGGARMSATCRVTSSTR